MNLIELKTGVNSSEFKFVAIILAVLSCQALGIDAAIILPLVLDGGDIVKYEELIKAIGGRSEPSDAAIFALAVLGGVYSVCRTYIKKLKATMPNGHPPPAVDQPPI